MVSEKQEKKEVENDVDKNLGFTQTGPSIHINLKESIIGPVVIGQVFEKEITNTASTTGESANALTTYESTIRFRRFGFSLNYL